LLGATAPAVLFTMWACNSHPLIKPDAAPVGELAQLREINPIRNVDIIFVVDNSGSMQEEQGNLTRNFGAFMRELNIPGANLHIAAISTELGAGAGTMISSSAQGCGVAGGDKGVFCMGHQVDTCAKCGVDVSRGRFLRTVNPNFAAGQLESIFTCMATFGTNGCGWEHSIGALRASLTAPENKDFLRDDAYLAFVIITDEDDCTAPSDSQMFMSAIPGQQDSLRCSVEGHICNGAHHTGTTMDVALDACAPATDGALVGIEQLVNDVKAVKKDPSLIIAAGIFGWPQPGQQAAARYRIGGGQSRTLSAVCNSNNGSATPALRVKKFVESFPNNNTFSICQNDFSEAMRRIGEKIRITLGAPCVDARLVDVNETTAEMDPDCSVTEEKPRSGGGFDLAQIGRCDAAGTPASGPCWRLVGDMACTTSRYKVEVDRRGSPDLPEGSRQTIRCLTYPQP
ncbi:MAG TPA: vWA domain-containing protein, partial [Polyangia bacterium]